MPAHPPKGSRNIMGLTSTARWKSFARAGNALGALSMVLALSGCGGGGGGSASGPTVVSPSPSASPSPTPTSSTCSLANRQAWARDVLEEWYLFPDLLDQSVRASDYADVQSYVDALVAPARAQSKDRGFTYLTSIEEEDAYYESGSTAGIGALLVIDEMGRLMVREAYENAAAYAAGMDRGTEILAIGTTSSNLVDVAAMDYNELVEALGPSESGVSRVFRFRPVSGAGYGPVQTATITKTDFDIQPLSPRYGSTIVDTGAGKYGYINLRTFIEPAEQPLRDAFAAFGAQGIDKVIVDVRYNGGGLIRTSQVLSELLNASHVGEEYSTLELRPSKASQNDTYYFRRQDGAINAMKVAFIGTSNSASASEMIMNAQIPYSGANTALIGENTYGKPVGQYAFDLEECDDRLRAVTFRTVNAAGNADYYTGMASTMPNACLAYDELTDMLGNPVEEMTMSAASFLESGYCQPLVVGTQGTKSLGKRAVMPRNPTIAQIEMPGLF